MRAAKTLSILLSLAFVCLGSNSTFAQEEGNNGGLFAPEPTPSENSNAENSTNLLGSLFEGDVHKQLMATTFKMLDTYLEYLAKPETTEKLAKFQMNYYQALIKQGFSPDQAFQLVLSAGTPLATPGKMGK